MFQFYFSILGCKVLTVRDFDHSMPYAFTGFSCNNNLEFVLSVQTNWSWLPTNNKIIIFKV